MNLKGLYFKMMMAILVLAIPLVIIEVWYNQKIKQLEIKVIESVDAPKAIGPYSQAVQSSNFLFLSGQIAINPKTNLLDTSSIENEVHQVMNNILAILKTEKLSAEHILKTTIYTTRLSDFGTINSAYRTYFPKGYFPARETVGVQSLPKGARVEISVVAVKNQ